MSSYRNILIGLLGGKCEFCKSEENLELIIEIKTVVITIFVIFNSFAENVIGTFTLAGRRRKENQSK